MDKFINLLLEKIPDYINTSVEEIIEKMEYFNVHIGDQLKELDIHRYEQCIKKNGFFLSYWFSPSPTKKIPQSLRLQVWRGDFDEDSTGKCFVCTTKITLFDFDCGHITSRKNNGDTNLSNLKPICRVCNLSMSSQNMNEYKEMFF